jgi:putative PIN family toxin of toxin-antitoxin system
MTKRRRQAVVIDTNVFIGNFLSHSSRSPNRRVIHLWLVDRAFKLVISAEIQREFLRIFNDILGFDSDRIIRWKQRFNNKRLTQNISATKALHLSRDPNDDMFIAVAVAARAKFLVTNDRDPLDISDEDKRKLKFQIVTPGQFLKQWDALQ